MQFAPHTTTATAVTGAAVTPTQLSVDVPAGAEDGRVTVSTPGGTATSSASFDVGTCITDVNPKQADVGTVVTITGVGFENATSVTFTGSGGTRVEAVFEVTSDTETTDTITATVPVGTINGPIQVVAPGGTAEFAWGDGDPFHPRSVTLTLRRHLVARGTVSADPALNGCVAGVRVKIQRRVSGRWRTVASTTTGGAGGYRKRIKDKPGRYRARAPQLVTTNAHLCLAIRHPS